MDAVIHSLWHALQPYIGEMVAALIIALAAKLHLDWSKHKAKIQEILDAIINEIANVENKQAGSLTPLPGREKKLMVSENIAQRFADQNQPWWSGSKQRMVLKAFGSIPAAVEKAFTLWSAARGIKTLLK